jgi:hypothetical protein
MSNRNNQRRRTSHRSPVLSDSDRIILNIYLNMYNQTVRDIDLLYQQVNVMYENLNSIRNIINLVTGVSDSLDTNTEDDFRQPTFGTFTRPSSNSYYNNDNSNLSLSSRLYLVSLARYLLDTYNEDTETTNNNRETEERERTRLRSRGGLNTRRRPNTTVFNTESINFDNIASGITGRFFPRLSSFYDNVPVYPTAEQVTSGTRRLLYSNIEEPLNITCPITLERFESDTEVLQILGCNHIFNPNSLQQWFQSNVRCPICRYDIRDYIPMNNRRRRFNYEETKEEESKEETKEEIPPPVYSSESSGSTLRTASSTPEPRVRNSVPEPTDNTEFINNLTSITENMLSDLFSSSFPNTQFNFNGTSYSVDVSNNEIIFQGYIHPNDGE